MKSEFPVEVILKMRSGESKPEPSRLTRAAVIVLMCIGAWALVLLLARCSAARLVEADAVALGADTCAEAAVDERVDPWAVDLVCLTSAGARVAVKMPRPEWMQIKAVRASVLPRDAEPLK
jgi:hypothetical protein